MIERTYLGLLFVLFAGCADAGGHVAKHESADNLTRTAAALPRLIVASKSGVRIWDDATNIGSDVPPSATLAGIDGQPNGVAVDGDTLLVTSSGASSAVHRFAGASTLADGALPESTVPTSAFGGTLHADNTEVDGRGSLWIQSGLRIQVLPRNATAPRASFTHPSANLEGMAYDEATDTLFSGQGEGEGLLAFGQASSRTGEVTRDYVVVPRTLWHLKIAGGRLFASSYSSPVRIWNDISAVTGPKAPDLEIAGLCDEGGVHGEIRYLTVQNDTLVVLHQAWINNALVEKACIFRDAHALTGLRAPDAVARGLDSTVYYDKAQLTQDGHLFVRDETGIVVFKDATTAPVLVTRLTRGTTDAVDFEVLE
ncbi:hypothetical protein LVJ94_08025 [Pendulispora rubella]|uniref:Phytase-like domain-containing protein n=1 Tax=Pendulispora rubella TaxID=2741070 RepID=A0ABZ2LEK2_9BACT